MTTLSLACADAFDLLREDLYTHLEEADCLANQDSEWSGDDIQTARGSSAIWYSPCTDC